jgi:integrase
MAEAVRFNEQITAGKQARKSARPPSFASIAEEYIKVKAVSMSAVSVDNLLYKMNGVILPRIGQMAAIRVTPDQLDQYVADRAGQVKRTTIHRELSDIRAVLRWAVRRGLLPSNPMDGYEMPKRDDATVLPLSHGEIQAIINHSPEHLRRAMLLSFFCGLRPGAVELLSIRYNQINWSAGTITIISAKKGGIDRREVPIHPDLPLRQWYDADGADPGRHVITWQGKPVVTIKRSWSTAKRAAGVGGRKIPPYALRKSFVTTLLHQGVDPETIAKIAGHDVYTMLKHYAYSATETARGAIAQLPSISLHPVGAEKEKNAPNDVRKN